MMRKISEVARERMEQKVSVIHSSDVRDSWLLRELMIAIDEYQADAEMRLAKLESLVEVGSATGKGGG